MDVISRIINRWNDVSPMTQGWWENNPIVSTKIVITDLDIEDLKTLQAEIRKDKTNDVC